MILRGEKRFKFNYNEVIKGKNLEQNIYLENGDHIIVP
jgi:polysaccharide export outer membrane protein